MSSIKTYPFQNSTILRVYSEQEVINISPEYQRKGGVWTLEKKQTLIDSILNDYDIPKLYFHLLSKNQRQSSQSPYDYSIIDGRQRIEAIFEFIDGVFEIPQDFEYLADPAIQAGGLTYTTLASEYPKLKIRFDSYILPVVLVETDDLDLIEDMFSRLNEAVPLNAAEKRNALGGEMARVIREVASHRFFREKVAFNDNRYQHREVAARVLFLMYSLRNSGRIVDTKKPHLDKMVRYYKENVENSPDNLRADVLYVLDRMSDVFVNRDFLLRSQATVTVFFLLFREAIKHANLEKLTRNALFDFYLKIDTNRRNAIENIAEADFELLEFERMTQQGTNDAFSIKERTRIMAEYLGIIEKNPNFTIE